jgi:hypothetical protein
LRAATGNLRHRGGRNGGASLTPAMTADQPQGALVGVGARPRGCTPLPAIGSAQHGSRASSVPCSPGALVQPTRATGSAQTRLPCRSRCVGSGWYAFLVAGACRPAQAGDRVGLPCVALGGAGGCHAAHAGNRVGPDDRFLAAGGCPAGCRRLRCSSRRPLAAQAIGSFFTAGRLSQRLPAATMQLTPVGVVLTTVQVPFSSEE